MKKYYVIVFALFSALQSGLLSAQDCAAYLPSNTTTKLEYITYDQKEKVSGYVTQQVKEIKNSGDTTLFYAYHENFDHNKELVYSGEMLFKCIDNTFILDMNSFINSQQMQAYKDMDMEISFDEVYIPANIKPGMTLEDGSITMNINMNGMMNMTFITTIKDRKVEAFEDVSTPAGNFKAYRVSYTIATDAGMMKTTMKSIDWYVENLGIVKSEQYNAKNKKMSSMILNKK